MRDIILTLAIVAGLPQILMHPSIGVYYWTWLGLMNPQRLTYGFAQSFPFSMLVAVATLSGILISRDPKILKGGKLSITLILFLCWMSLTTLFALHPVDAQDYWLRVLKIDLMTLVAILVLNTRKQLDIFIWVAVVSLGYFGTKGGVFTVLSGGSYKVYGPDDSMVADNNALAVGVVMLIPLMYYLLTQASNKWIRRGLIFAAVSCSFSALGSQSRGALLAIGAMTLLFWLKNKKNIGLSLLIVLAVPLMINFMPESWTSRMKTMQTYQQDASAMDRLNSWITSWNIATDRVTGAGFVISFPDIYAKYSPDPTLVHVAHSIYFQVMGEHGYIGLAIFLTIWLLAWQCANRIIKNANARGPNYIWAVKLASMVQASIAAYLVGGTFLNLAYLDLAYYLVVILIVTEHILNADPSGKNRASPRNEKTGGNARKGFSVSQRRV